MQQQSIMRRGVCAALALSVLVIAGCSNEQAVSKSEFKRLTSDLDEGPYRVEGEPFSGEVVVHEGEDALWTRMVFEDGYPDGEWITWHENGEKALEFEQVQWEPEDEELVRTGAVREWDEQGTLRRERVYDDEHELVESSRWCENGEINETMEPADDDGRHMQAFDCDSGKQTLEATANASGRKIGDYRQWHADGQPQVEASYEDGNLVGEKKQWYPDGQMQSQASYLDGAMDGVHNQWYANGQQQLKEHYQGGQLDGEYQAWGEDGKLSEQGQYAAGEKTGIWLQRDYDGTPQKWHYGPNGFIDSRYLNVFAVALTAFRGQANPDTVKLLINEGKVSVNDAIPTGGNHPDLGREIDFPVRGWSYPVILATRSNLQFLLDKGADINQIDSQGRNRVNYCAERFNDSNTYSRQQDDCDLAMLKNMLALGASAKRVDIEGNTALHRLAKGSDNDRGWNRDNEALGQARVAATQALVAAGTPIDVQDSDGKTALMHALQERNAPLSLALLEIGADVKPVSKTGAQALHYVFLVSDDRYQMRLEDFSQQMLKALVAHGADVNAPMQWNGKPVTLRDLALQHGLTDLVRYIDSLG